MKKNLVRAALGIFILFVINSSAYSQWIQTNWSEDNSFFELYTNEDVVFARTWDRRNGGRVFFTDDNGDNWALISSPDSDIDILSVVMKDNQILAGAWDGLYRTMLSDISWEEFTPTGIPADSPIWSISRIGDTFFAAGMGAVYKASIDNIDTWTAVSTGIPAETHFTSIIKKGNALLAGSDNSGVFISTDDGASWMAINSGLTDLHIFNLEVVDTKLFAVTFKKGVFILDINDIDLISNYESINWEADDSGLKPINCLLNTEDLLFAGTDTNGVYLSDDNGQNWLPVNSGFPENIRIFSLEINNDNIFAGTTEGILKLNPEDINNYTISVSATEGGAVSPESDIIVYEGGSRTFTITPELGYKINDVLVDGSSLGAVYSYAFSNVTADHTISVEFLAVPIYTITSSSEEGGTILPSGAVQLSESWSQEFTITAFPGNAISDVLVDGSSVGAVSSYTFTDVAENHTISVIYEEAPFIITASAGDGGTISPSGDVEVWGGDSQTFTFTDSEGYEISDVNVDGVSVGAVDSYTFSSVDDNHTITVSFLPLIRYQINCGSEDEESPFIADNYYEGGSTSYLSWGSVSIGNITDPAPENVYKSDRNGDFTYTFPEMESGVSYTVRLHFSDNSWGGWGGSSNEDTFYVTINGTTVLSEYNIYSEAGGRSIAIVEEFTTTADESGQIVIEFIPTYSNYDAKVGGIEIIKQ